MKKFLAYVLIILIGATGVYFGLTKLNKKDEKKQPDASEKKEEEKNENEIIPSKESFVTEATKLQTLAENTNGTETCKCYNAKELDRNTSLNGSILVYTSGDIFVSSVWLSNGYYYIEDSEYIAEGMLEESDKTASVYCGETSTDVRSYHCDLGSN